MTTLGYEFVYIYALPRTGTIRYIGRSIDPDTRLRQHWRNRDYDLRPHRRRRGPTPLNFWLRSRKTCPEMRILARVEETDGLEDWPFIEAYRKAHPGKLTNLDPSLADDAPEWKMFERLGKADDPNFDYEAFHEEKMSAQRENSRKVMIRTMKALWADPDFRLAQAERLAIMNADPEFKIRQAEGAGRSMAEINKRKWADPEWREMMISALYARNEARAKNGNGPCQIDDGDGPCGRPHKGNGMCHKHWQRARGRAKGAVARARYGPCEIDDGDGPCGKPNAGRGMCKIHYSRWRDGSSRKGPVQVQNRTSEFCEIDDGDGPCGGEYRARGMCGKHYQREKAGILLVGPFAQNSGPCEVDDGDGPCGRPHKAHGLCHKHWQRRRAQERRNAA